MAIQTEYKIKLACGHTETRDLSDRPAGKRSSFKRWLEQHGDCKKCWKAKNADELYKKEAEAANDFTRDQELPDLTGSEKQLKWANIFRFSVLDHAHQKLVEEGELSEEDFEERIMVHARKITFASWWFDNKDNDPEDLEELVSNAIDEEPDKVIETENPY